MEDSSLSTDWLRVVYTADYFPSLGRLWPQKAGEGIGLNAEKLLLEMVMMGLTCIPCEPGDCLSVACVNIRRPHGHLSLLGHREQLLQTRWARRGGWGPRGRGTGRDRPGGGRSPPPPNMAAAPAAAPRAASPPARREPRHLGGRGHLRLSARYTEVARRLAASAEAPPPLSRGPASRRAARSRRLAAAAAEPALPARAHGAAVRGNRGSSTPRRARPAAAGGPACAAELAEPGGALQPPRLLLPMRAARDQALHAENVGFLDAGGTAPAGASSTPPRSAPGPGTGAFLHPSSRPASPRAGGKEAARGGEGNSRHGPSCSVRGGPGGGRDVVSVLLQLRRAGWGVGGSEGAALVLGAIAPSGRSGAQSRSLCTPARSR